MLKIALGGFTYSATVYLSYHGKTRDNEQLIKYSKGRRVDADDAVF